MSYDFRCRILQENMSNKRNLIKITNFFNKKTKTQEQDRNVRFLDTFIFI